MPLIWLEGSASFGAIEKVAEEMVRTSDRLGCGIMISFNGIWLLAAPGTEVERIVNYYNDEIANIRKAKWGKKA